MLSIQSLQIFGRNFQRATHLACVIINKRSIQNWPEVNPADTIFMPQEVEDRLLPEVPPTPTNYPTGVVPPLKQSKANDDMRGPERIHNQLIYRQYGIIALGGGALVGAHFEMMRARINRFLDTERMFAIWRVDPPWKSVTKKSLGKKMGGGKAKVHHFETPVKAGRIILEVAGIGEYGEIEPHLLNVTKKLPFYAMPISQKIMDDLKEEKLALDANNYNPFEYRYCLRKNMSNSQRQVSPKEILWGGTYF